MSTAPKPTKLIVIIAGAALMIGIALAIVLNYQANVTAQDESREEMPEIDVAIPEGIVMQRGETKVIPLEVRIVSKAPLDAQIVVFSTTPDTAEQETTMSDSDNLHALFEELRQKEFTDGFAGSLDVESFSSPGNPNGDATIETANLTLTASTDIAAGNYYFANSVLGDTTTWDFISSGLFEVEIK